MVSFFGVLGSENSGAFHGFLCTPHMGRCCEGTLHGRGSCGHLPYRGSSCVPFEILAHIFSCWFAHEYSIRASSQPVKETNCAEWGDSFTLSPRSK